MFPFALVHDLLVHPKFIEKRNERGRERERGRGRVIEAEGERGRVQENSRMRSAKTTTKSAYGVHMSFY